MSRHPLYIVDKTAPIGLLQHLWGIGPVEVIFLFSLFLPDNILEQGDGARKELKAILGGLQMAKEKFGDRVSFWSELSGLGRSSSEP